jgi:hypothetical protein
MNRLINHNNCDNASGKLNVQTDKAEKNAGVMPFF